MSERRKHSPTPWTLGEDWERDWSEDKYADLAIHSQGGYVLDLRVDHHELTVDGKPSKEDMEHIVRCVNAHEELVEALSVVIRGVPDTWEGVQKAKVVIDKSKEKKPNLHQSLAG